MKSAKHTDLLKSLDRIIDQMEIKMRPSSEKSSLILSHPDEKSMFSSLSLKGVK